MSRSRKRRRKRNRPSKSQTSVKLDDSVVVKPGVLDAELGARTTWLHLGEQGKRIRKVVEGIDADDDMAAFSAWEQFLKQHLVFPFDATVFEHWMWGPDYEIVADYATWFANR